MPPLGGLEPKPRFKAERWDGLKEHRCVLGVFVGFGQINEVKLTNQSNELISFYEMTFERKFHVKPAITDRDFEVTRWLLKSYPVQKAKELLTLYLSIPDQWFHEQSYSLSCLQKNVNKVLINYGQRSHRTGTGHLKIRFKRGCDGGTDAKPCPTYLDLELFTNELDRLTFCDQCNLYGI